MAAKNLLLISCFRAIRYCAKWLSSGTSKVNSSCCDEESYTCPPSALSANSYYYCLTMNNILLMKEDNPCPFTESKVLWDNKRSSVNGREDRRGRQTVQLFSVAAASVKYKVPLIVGVTLFVLFTVIFKSDRTSQVLGCLQDSNRVEIY